MPPAPPVDALALARELLATPREAGTPSADAARNQVAAFLTRLGFQVEHQRFAFTTSGLLAFPLFGAGLGWLTILEIPLLIMPSVPGWAAVLIWVPGVVALGIIAMGLALGWSDWRGERREDTNLIATHGDAVRRWIVAHHDTKAQGHSMAGRLVAVWIAALASGLMTILVLVRLGNPLPIMLVAGATGLALVAGYLAGRGRLAGQSPGARDNGTGLLAALTAASLLEDPAVGILITGAEEFGLVGARYFAQQCGDRLRDIEVINLDTIDDQGSWRLVVHGRTAHELADRVATALRDSQVAVRQHRLPLGIFVDSLALSKAGARAITIARLNWGTLQTIHTAGDRLEGLSLESAAEVGRVIAGLAVGEG
jgi:hypothetical protein